MAEATERTNRRDEIASEWQRRIWRVSFVVAFIVLGFELLYLVFKEPEDIGYFKYFIRYILIPCSENFFILILTYVGIKSPKINDSVKSFMACLNMCMIGTVVGYIHFVFYPVILIPIMSIMFTSIFGKKWITFSITGLSVVSVVISNMRYYTLDYVQKDLGIFYFSGYLIGAIILTISTGIFANYINKHTNQIMNAINMAYMKEMNLISELKIEPLTGLYNRRAFEDTVKEEITRMGNSDRTSWLAIFDIDHFKDVNDTYGHSNGDIVLKELAKIFQDKVKEQGLAYRYGGEEFVIIFNTTNKSDTLHLVEDIRTTFRCTYFQFMKKDGITISCGLAEYKPGESEESWFNRADSALYEAKETGRNKSIISE